MVLRGLAFMGDALSHSAFPGVVVAYLLNGPFYLGAAIAAVATALAIGWVTPPRQAARRHRDRRPLRRRCSRSASSCSASIPNYVGDLFGFLFGEILGIGTRDLLALSVLAVIVLAVVVHASGRNSCTRPSTRSGAAAAGLPVVRLDYLFLALIALTIVVSLQAVGIILVVAMLVTPAATAQLLSHSFARLISIAIAIGVVCPVIGLYLSFWLNSASGATIVLVETASSWRRSCGRAAPRSARRPDNPGRDATRPGPGGPASSRIWRRLTLPPQGNSS